MKQEKKGFMSDDAYTILALFDISPPIGSKARKINSAIKTRKFEKDEIAARGWAVTGDGRLDLGPNWSILGKVTSAAFNLPLDRVVDELASVSEAFDARNTAWQRFALAMGYKTWDIGAKDELGDLIRAEADIKRKEESKRKAAEKRRKKAEEKKAIEAAKTPEQKEAERKEKEAEKEAKRKEKEAKRQKVIEDKSIVDQEAIYDLTKSQQIEALKNLGLDLDFIKTLKKEEQRVNKIIELRNKIKK
jgi:flagellar biosynthesis GTPase FlhF